MKSDIKIFVSCHKKSILADNPLLYPVQVGAALAGSRLPGMYHDDEGDNISAKNRKYCEVAMRHLAQNRGTLRR